MSVPPPGVRYDSDVVAVGELIPEFAAQGLLVFFGELAPQELHEFVLLHRPRIADSSPRPGDDIELDGEVFRVTAVGEVVAENLLRLGHFSLKADGSTTAPMPGDVCVEARAVPVLGVGSRWRILAAAPTPSTPSTHAAPTTFSEETS